MKSYRFWIGCVGPKALEALKSIRQTIPPEHPAEYSEFTTIRNVTTAAIKLLEAE